MNPTFTKLMTSSQKVTEYEVVVFAIKLASIY